MKKGEVTAFLSLIFILMLSVIGGVIESASIQVTKNKRRTDVERAMESVFAEYQKELLETYDVFALEGTYEGEAFSEENVIERLKFYGAQNTEHQVSKIQFLTDYSGRAFREQVIAYMKNKAGITGLEDLTNSMGTWKEQENQTEEYQQEDQEVTEEISASLAEAGKELPAEDNPIGFINRIKNAGLLSVVLHNRQDISNKNISVETTPSHRSLQKGRGNFKVRDDTDDIMSKIYFGEYQLEKFASAVQPNEEGKLSYELEYIIGGKGSDKENLEAVIGKLMAVRFAANYSYLMTDEEKKAEAKAMALTMAGVVALPEISELIKQGILLAWAFGESIMDIRSLMEGGKIELLKTKQSWQLQLSSLLKLGTEEDHLSGEHSEEGLSYKEYLRMLLVMNPIKEATMRTIDIVEMGMQMKKGAFFKADYCISKLEIKSRCRLRRGISYEFMTEYGYL